MREIWGKQVCETLDEVLEPGACALLVVDMQNDAVRPEGKIAQAGNDISGMLEILPRCAALIGAARALDIPVVHVQFVMLHGRSDAPPWLRSKGLIAGTPDFFLEETWGAELCAECAPLRSELDVVKRRPGAFHRTDLDLLLRAMDVRTVVVIGEQTPGCIESTARDAINFDYYAVVVEDCVAAFDSELHEASLKVQRSRYDVAPGDAVLAAWGSKLTLAVTASTPGARLGEPARVGS